MLMTVKCVYMQQKKRINLPGIPGNTCRHSVLHIHHVQSSHASQDNETENSPLQSTRDNSDR